MRSARRWARSILPERLLLGRPRIRVISPLFWNREFRLRQGVRDGRDRVRSDRPVSRQRPLLSAPGRDPLLIDQNLDPPIATPTTRGAVVGDRLGRAVGNHANLGRIEALLADQISGDAGSAALAELVVVVLMADAVG